MIGAQEIKSFLIRSLFLIFFVITLSSSQTVINFECQFVTSQVAGHHGYTCSLRDAVNLTSEYQTIIVSGIHFRGSNNSNVENISIENQQSNFIISQLFEVFPNFISYEIRQARIQEIQRDAFKRASNLERVQLSSGRLTTIGATTFTQTPKLIFINLINNQIETIDKGAFAGLMNLRSLWLDNNKIKVIQPNLFRSLTSLRTLYLGGNQIEVLHENLFSNTSLREIFLHTNQINSIAPSFLVTLPETWDRISLTTNRCVAMEMNRGITLSIYERSLTRCFDNYETVVPEPEPEIKPEEPGTEMKHYKLKLRGHLRLHDTNGTLIGKL